MAYDNEGGGGAHNAAGGALAALLQRANLQRANRAKGGPAPVETWHPDHCGTIPIHIDANGNWFHEGSYIARESLVRLFASILRRESDGSFVLVTPVEKMTITVEDAPFAAVELAASGEGETQTLTVRTNVGDVIAIGPEHPLRVALDDPDSGFVPYVRVRGGLDARFTRSVAHQLADYAIWREDGRVTLVSGGMEFELHGGY